MDYTVHGDDRGVIIVARDPSLVAGYIQVVPRSMAYGQETAGRKYAEIRDLHVATESRRQGIGTALIDEAIGWAQTNGFTHLNVGASAKNESTLNFYNANGFEARSVILDLAL